MWFIGLRLRLLTIYTYMYLYMDGRVNKELNEEQSRGTEKGIQIKLCEHHTFKIR